MDGGYYAIKGFEYQIDKNILEILKQSDINKLVNVEQNQDIDSSDFVMQVKYKEAAKFVPSAIKNPLIQLIDEFKVDKTKKYILYCYFGDFNGYTESTPLDTILGSSKSNYSSKEKTDFQTSFHLRFSPKFDIQLEQTISEIMKLGFQEEEAIIHHCRITKHLRNLVVNHAPTNVTNRSTTKKEVIELIKNDRKILFTNSFRTYKGELQYFKKLKKEYFTFRNVDKTVRIFIIELTGTESTIDLVHIAKKISSKYFKLLSRDIKGESPFIFYRNITERGLVMLKTRLIEDGIVLKDGYDFKGASFNINSITIKSTKENKVAIKFINQEDDLVQILDVNLNITKEVVQYFYTKPEDYDHRHREIKIEIKALNEIEKIIE